MEFWGVEVKSGEPLKVTPGEGMILHLSQACLGELKKEKSNDSVHLFVNVEGKKLVLGTLFAEKLPQQQFDLVFDKDFEISHNSKSASVYFYGYLANSFDDSDEEIPLTIPNNGIPEPKAKEEKSVEAAKANAAKGKGKKSGDGKQKVKIVEPSTDEDDDSSDEDLMSEDDDEDDTQDEDNSGDESESEEETPKKAEPSKKRPAESATKTPVPDKKAKVTPQKTDGKKVGGHVATPHPAKQGKTPGNKPNQQTPKSGGSHSCASCNRAFNSEQGLESHNKAKHSAGK
ncbi:histone deacetylase hdt1 [Phtheirospermum japonicum]|uniref:Histone deacetylase hdt1 n=1 Tax=Phtheirospermum japonicum TaxID=374723 RepID=A0A830D6J3_9LAMI|nr:histone deacetylase hdt1 [Phtheirospermum japonicum]